LRPVNRVREALGAQASYVTAIDTQGA